MSEETTTPAEQPAMDYRKQYEAALKAGEKATHAHESALAQLQAEKQAHEGTRASLTRLQEEFTGLNGTLAGKDTELSALQERVHTLEPALARAMRLELILNEYPQLAPFEKDGLLPGGDTPQTLRDLLGRFSGRLEAHAKAHEASFASGGKPENVPVPEPRKSPAEAARDHLEAAIHAQRRGDMAEYEIHFNQYLLEQNKKQA